MKIRTFVPLAALLAACSAPTPAGVESSPAPPAPATVVTSAPAAPSRLIGRRNPAVTQATIRTTVCVPGWTAKIRPPASYTNALKIRQLHAAGLDPAAYEEDHLMPLALGGAPRDPANLKPILWKRARLDDVWETR